MFKKTISIDGKFKALVISNGNFVDVETGETINLVEALSDIYGEDPFSLTTNAKASEEIA